jgi:hypothetical protein
MTLTKNARSICAAVPMMSMPRLFEYVAVWKPWASAQALS